MVLRGEDTVVGSRKIPYTQKIRVLLVIKGEGLNIFRYFCFLYKSCTRHGFIAVSLFSACTFSRVILEASEIRMWIIRGHWHTLT